MDRSKKLLKIGQLAKITGISPSTIKYYVKEGLLPNPVKPNKTMAYYDKSCIEKIHLIKKFQKEKFLPLEIIKRMINLDKPYEEELSAVVEVLKMDNNNMEIGPIKESQIAQHTAYPLEKIGILEENGLVTPEVVNNVKQYDESDCRIIELVKQRDELGIPFDYTLEVFKCYQDAMAKAVVYDQQLFIERIQGFDLPKESFFKSAMQLDMIVDSFLLPCRKNLMKLSTRQNIHELNQLSEQVVNINILPLNCAELPTQPPKHLMERCFYYMCGEDYHHVRDTLFKVEAGKRKTIAIDIMIDLLEGQIELAITKVERNFPKPSDHLLGNVVAALTHLYQITKTSGITEPILSASKLKAYLRRIDILNESPPLMMLISQYVCGILYVMLPNIIGHQSRGFEKLSLLKKNLSKREYDDGKLPDWIIRTLDFEILPALKIRVNRYLAEGYLKCGKKAEALKCLDELIAIDLQESDQSKWARIKRLSLTSANNNV